MTSRILVPQSPLTRESIRTAQGRIKRHLQKAAHQPRHQDISDKRKAQPLTTDSVAPPSVRFFVKPDYHDDRRGVANAMECLIEKKGLGELQRSGVIAQSDGTDMQGIPHRLRTQQFLRTNAMPDLYVKQIAMAAKAYRITTYALLPESTQRSKIEDLQAYGVIVELSKDNGRGNRDLLARTAAHLEAYQFPSRDEADVIQGHGTVALELEDEVKSILETDGTIPNRGAGKLDIVIAIMGNGSALCGICMAFQQTGTRVFGAEMTSENGGNVRRDLAYSDKEEGGRYNNRSAFNAPMGALPWSVFTSPSMLSGVLYVDKKAAELARGKLLEQLRVKVGPHDAAPLALGVYSEEFRQLLEKDTAEDRVWNVGVIIQSEISMLENERPKTLSESLEDDLKHYMSDLWL